MHYNTYRIVTSALSPLITIWLRIRQLRGKESRERFNERFGYAKITRPKGMLLWLHAASVGEANSVLFLIEQIKSRFSDINILLTTGTVTSAKLIEKRAIPGVIHQFVPVDTPEATNRFLKHFRPDIGFWVESELWPNLVINAKARGCLMFIINGRMSVKSYNSWQKFALLMIYQMLNCFELVFAQSENDGQRFRALGAREVRCVGNLKYDAAALPCNESDLFSLQQQIGIRQVWLAASTHHNEEEQVIKAYNLVAAKHLDLLTIIAPRHPQRGEEIAKMTAKSGKTALRSRGDKITADTKFYIADTLGELGLFYRLSEIVFMGGSLVTHGGQNPLEPARLRCSIITGPHTENFSVIYKEMENLSICVRVNDATELATKVNSLMQDSDTLTKMQMQTREWLRGKNGAANKIVDIVAPIFTPINII